MGYLISRLPSDLNAFILNEIFGLRARGLYLQTASTDLPVRSDSPSSARLPSARSGAEAGDVRKTFFLRSQRTTRTAARLLQTVLKHPEPLFRGLLYLLRLRGLRTGERFVWLIYLAEALLVGRWMRSEQLGHLHVPCGGRAATVGLLTAKAWKLPFSLTIHGPEEFHNLQANQLPEKVNAAKFVFCVSDFCRSQLLALAPPATWGKFEVVRFGVDPLVLTPATRFATHRAHARSQELRLVSAGPMIWREGHQVLLEAVALLRERGLELQVVLSGGGSDLPRLQSFVSARGLADSVSFTHTLSHAQTVAHLRRADIFVSTSFWAGLPTSLMEAMSLGLPCVAPAVAGIPELIRSGVDGLLVSPGNPEALAAALELIASDPAQRKSLGASARQRIINQYNLPLNQELLAHSFKLRTSATYAG